jgi:uncharacterized protein YukE
MLAQTTEIIKEGQNFAERFGWEALVIVIFLGFIMWLAWKWGDRIVNAMIDYVAATKEQYSKVADANKELAQAMVGLANAQAACVVSTEKTSDRIERVIESLKRALDAAETLVQDNDAAMKKKIADIRAALNE